MTNGRDYQRGYYRGRTRMGDRVRAVLKIAHAYRDRAILAERKRDGSANWISRECQTCARWTRGTKTTHWGVCAGVFETGAGEPGMWADADTDASIVTDENFGCCSWLHPEHPLRQPFDPKPQEPIAPCDDAEFGMKP